MKLSLPNDALGHFCVSADIRDETHNCGGQVEVALETVGERAEMAFGVPGTFEDLERLGEHYFDVSPDSIDLFELRLQRVARLALTRDFDCVSAADIGDHGQAREGVGLAGQAR